MKIFYSKINPTSLLVLFAFLLAQPVLSQNFVWAKKWGGIGYEDGRSIAIDPSGNVICAGSFSGTADFDPNAGTFNMTAAGTSNDVYIVKLTAAGNLVWARQIGIAGQYETASDIEIDPSGNIHIVGAFYGTTDFNPGAGINNLTSAGANDVYVLKLDNNGNYLGAWRAGSTAADFPNAIDLDASGAMYVTGQVSGVADLDPGAGTYTVAAYGGQDAFVFKWTSAGAFVWGATMGASGGDQGSDIKVNNAGTSVYVSGYFAGTGAEISPFCSCGTENSAGGNDIFVVKLATSGGFQANAIMGGTLNESASGIELDASDNVYLTGAFDGLSDMDPGFGTANLAGAGGFADIYVTKLTNNLAFVFAKQFSGSSTESGVEIKLDPAGSIYVTGSFNDIVDFDPSPATYTVQTIGSSNSDVYVLKLDNNGNLTWVKTWGSANGDNASDIDLDAAGNIYTTGAYFTNCDMDPGAGVSNFTTTGGSATDAFIHKLSCTLPANVSSTASNYTICAGTPTSSPLSITASSIQPVTNYGWSVVGATGVGFSPATGTTTSMTFTGSTSFSIIVTATNACGTTTSNVNNVFVNPKPTVVGIASPTAVCSGSMLTLYGSGANTYTWSSGVSNSVPFTPSASATYTVWGTAVTSCTNMATITVNQAPNPTVTVSGTSVICKNKPQVLTASGASTYTWFPGGTVASSITATPSVTTVYTINATSLNGCNGGGSFTVNIVSPPTPDICQVTTDSLGFNNEIYWDKTNYPSADSFIVYRETSLSTYKRLAAIHKSAFSMYVDTNRSVGPANGDPDLTYYKYKLQLRDSCGNYSAMSKWHETIFIQDQLNGNFNWNSYGIEASAPPITLYNVKRRSLATGTETLIASTVGNLANDPFYASFWPMNVKWFVDAQGFNCNPTAKTAVLKTKTKSNQSNDKLAMTGINGATLAAKIGVYPNPATDVVNIDLNSLPKTETTVEIMNAIGQVVFETKSLNQHLVINTNELSGGVYIINIKQNDKRVAVKKVVIEK
jgi:hypothetical protein